MKKLKPKFKFTPMYNEASKETMMVIKAKKGNVWPNKEEEKEAEEIKKQM